MLFVKKHWFKAILIFILLGGLYLGTRLFNLTKLPIFTDEAIYIRWSQIGSRDPNWRFISLVDGKQPMFTWIMMVFLRILRDPLFAGRLVSVFAGAASALGIGVLTYEVFRNKQISMIAVFLYILSPFALMYDRLALYDSLVATFSIWSLYLSIRLVKTLRLDMALLLGMVLGAGMLNKTSGFLSLYLLPATLVLFDFQKPERVKRLMQWGIFVFVATLISQLLYGILRLSPLFHMVGQKDSVFVYSFKDWVVHPFTFLEGNLKGLFDWLISYLTPPIFIASLIPLFTLWRQGREKLLLYIWWAAPFFALALFGRILYPRFILFMSMPLLILASVSIFWIWKNFGRKIFGIAILVILFLPSFYTDYFIVTNPLYAPIHYADRGQLIDSWPAGWGVSEVNTFFLERLKFSKVSVYTEGTFGLLPAAIEIYLVDKPNIDIHGIWPLPEHILPEMLVSARDHETYFIFNQTQETPLGWPILLLAEYQKGLRENRKLRLYKVIPQSVSKL